MSRLTVAPVVLAAAIGAAMFIKEQEGILQARAFDYAQHDRHHRPRIAMALETIAGTPAAKNADMAGLYEIGKHASEFLHARGFVVRDPTGHELNHRVKKTLSIVQGLALLTRRHTKTLLEFTRSFEASLVALAKPHYILSRVNWTDCELRNLVLECCAGFLPAERLSIAGKRAVLTLNAAVKLCMVLHELASNATKHGALKAEHGRIDIRWMLSADGASLSVSWQEQDGAVREGASEKGFGSALITTLVEKDLNGTMEAAWARTAFACASNCRRTRCSPCRPQQVWPCLKRNTRPAAKPA